MPRFLFTPELPCDKCGLKPTFTSGTQYLSQYLSAGNPDDEKDEDTLDLFEEYKDLYVVFCEPDCRLFESEDEDQLVEYWNLMVHP